MEDNHYWDEELWRIDDEYKKDYQVYSSQNTTFETFLSNLKKQIEKFEPSLQVYHKKNHVGSIHYVMKNGRTKTYSFNLHLSVDVSKLVTKITKDQGHVTLYSMAKTRWSTPQGELNQETFYVWVENILNVTLAQLYLEQGISNKITISRTGEFMDLMISENKQIGFLVKIIPGLVFTSSKTLDSCYAVVDRNCFKRRYQLPPTSWRLTYPTREERILKDEPILKMTIRFMKLIRDSYEMTYIPDYAIKMMFLTLTGGYGNTDFFRQSLTNILKQIVAIFEEKIIMKNINDAWDYQYNTLNDCRIDEGQFDDCLEKIQEIGQRLNNKKDNIEKILFNIPLNDDNFNVTPVIVADDKMDEDLVKVMEFVDKVFDPINNPDVDAQTKIKPNKNEILKSPIDELVINKNEKLKNSSNTSRDKAVTAVHSSYNTLGANLLQGTSQSAVNCNVGFPLPCSNMMYPRMGSCQIPLDPGRLMRSTLTFSLAGTFMGMNRM